MEKYINQPNICPIEYQRHKDTFNSLFPTRDMRTYYVSENPDKNPDETQEIFKYNTNPPELTNFGISEEVLKNQNSSKITHSVTVFVP